MPAKRMQILKVIEIVQIVEWGQL